MCKKSFWVKTYLGEKSMQEEFPGEESLVKSIWMKSMCKKSFLVKSLWVKICG